MNKLFVLGCPRSGTTMLQQALNRHSRIVVAPETKLLFSFVGRCQGCQAKHVERLNADLGIEIPDSLLPVRSAAQTRVFLDQVASLYLSRLGRTDVAYFGDKTPEHTGFFARIKRVFPSARFLLIYRDGRDVALSLSKMPWMRPNALLGFAIWLFYVRAQSRFANDPAVHWVRYEDLVTDPDGELRRVTAFLGLEYESAMATGYGNTEGIPVREYPWKARALARISSERVGLWRKELSGEDIAFMERIGGGALRSLNYELSKVRGGASLASLARFVGNAAAFLWRLPLDVVSNQILGRPLCMH